jgi:hypothetical protein
MSNKITTQGYFIKRLRDCGYSVWKLYDAYSDDDPRAWTVIIDPGHASVLCTCYINAKAFGVTTFEIYDGGQFIPEKFKVSTDSIEVIVSYLVKFGINNKSGSYGEEQKAQAK